MRVSVKSLFYRPRLQTSIENKKVVFLQPFQGLFRPSRVAVGESLKFRVKMNRLVPVLLFSLPRPILEEVATVVAICGSAGDFVIVVPSIGNRYIIEGVVWEERPLDSTYPAVHSHSRSNHLWGISMCHIAFWMMHVDCEMMVYMFAW